MTNKKQDLDDLFEEMFGKEDTEQQEQEQNKVENSQWLRLDGRNIEIVTLNKEDALQNKEDEPELMCQRCGKGGATYSEHYKGQWCLYCWF